MPNREVRRAQKKAAQNNLKVKPSDVGKQLTEKEILDAAYSSKATASRSTIICLDGAEQMFKEATQRFENLDELMADAADAVHSSLEDLRDQLDLDRDRLNGIREDFISIVNSTIEVVARVEVLGNGRLKKATAELREFIELGERLQALQSSGVLEAMSGMVRDVPVPEIPAALRKKPAQVIVEGRPKHTEFYDDNPEAIQIANKAAEYGFGFGYNSSGNSPYILQMPDGAVGRYRSLEALKDLFRISQLFEMRDEDMLRGLGRTRLHRMFKLVPVESHGIEEAMDRSKLPVDEIVDYIANYWKQQAEEQP